MENYKKKAINLLIELALTENKHPAVIPYKPAKLKTSKKEISALPRRLGGQNHLYAIPLLNILEELEEEKRANIHSIIVMKNREIILEAASPGYDAGYWHLAHSMAKTVTALAVGFLYDEAKLSLDDNVLDFFPEITDADERYSDLKIYDLITMRAGSSFAELGTVTENEWTKAFFSSKPTSKIGEEFSYNSINSYILGRIITKITGKPLYEFVNERLFTPLGITNHFWEESPEGFTKGGFGLYLSTESFVKLGQLVLERGTFFNHRLLSEEYITKMCKCISAVPNSIGDFDYGMHVWVSPDGNEILFNGMLGQNVWIYPKENIVAAFNSGNNELFSDSPALSIIRRNLKSDLSGYTATRDDYRRLKSKINSFFLSRRSIVTTEEKRGLLYFLGIKERRPFNESFTSLLGRYALRHNNASILPLFVSVMQNNYQGGIEYFDFRRIGQNLFMTSVEDGIHYNIPIGLYDYKESVVDFHDEKYIVRASAEILFDEDRNPVYKIELIFPELPNVRTLKITHTDEGILVRMSEMPNEKIAESFFESITAGGKSNFVINLIEKKMGEGFIKNKISSLFNPNLAAIRTTVPNFEEIITLDNKKITEDNEKAAKIFKMLTSKFLSEEKSSSDKNDHQPSKVGSFFKSALSLLLKFAKAKPEDSSKDTIIEIPDDAITFLDFSDTEEYSSESEDI